MHFDIRKRAVLRSPFTEHRCRMSAWRRFRQRSLRISLRTPTTVDIHQLRSYTSTYLYTFRRVAVEKTRGLIRTENAHRKRVYKAGLYLMHVSYMIYARTWTSRRALSLTLFLSLSLSLSIYGLAPVCARDRRRQPFLYLFAPNGAPNALWWYTCVRTWCIHNIRIYDALCV